MWRFSVDVAYVCVMLFGLCSSCGCVFCCFSVVIHQLAPVPPFITSIIFSLFLFCGRAAQQSPFVGHETYFLFHHSRIPWEASLHSFSHFHHQSGIDFSVSHQVANLTSRVSLPGATSWIVHYITCAQRKFTNGKAKLGLLLYFLSFGVLA